jgi:protein ImuB
MIACLVIPGFELRAALRKQPGVALRPAALAPVPGTEPLIGPVTAAAAQVGVRPGMRLGEALATCPQLLLVEQDPAEVEQAWEEILRALEDSGFAVDAAQPGCAYFETRGVERLYGGLEPALRRALAAVGAAWDARVGAAELGVKKVGQLAGLPGGAVAERLGPDGRRAWGLARGGKAARVHGRRPAAEVVEALEFPEAVGNELTLRRAFGALLDAVLARPERAGRFIRRIALAARLVSGGSWRRTVTLRDATADPDRLKAALAPKLTELPAPVVELRLELVELTEHDGQQLELLPAAGGELDVRLREGLRQVRASTGTGSVNQVVEVAPWSRIPESRAMFVPRDD